MTSPAWPAAVFDAPVLRGLDARSRDELEAAGALVDVAAGERVYASGDVGDAFYVVVSGAVELEVLRRGDEHESPLRVARRGDTFGEEAALPGALRRGAAVAAEPSRLAAVPMAVFQRAATRAGAGGLAERELRLLERTATRDLLATLAFARELGADDLDLLLDAVRSEHTARASRIYGAGDVARDAFLVAEGVVQLQVERDGAPHVVAYLARGDFFGDDELLSGELRRSTAVALGECWCLRVPGAALATLADRNPGLLPRLRRVAVDRRALQQAVVGEAAARSTQHVFHDLYRVQMARSLLAIDQDTCVRCGHCAWACADVHGTSRLVRRGDKVVTQLAVVDAAPKSLLLPNSCQHCKNPACMIDCPTGAIGRDPEGEVFIREELCTGCGACAKACPWDNIRMAGKLAVKCDLCHDYDAPACVQACPTEAILRLDPARDFDEVRRVLGDAPGAARASLAGAGGLPVAAGVAVAIALGALAERMQALGSWAPGHGAGYVWGLAGGVACVGLAAYALPKRRTALWMKPRAKRERLTPGGAAVARSRLKPQLALHVVLGAVTMAAVLAHAGARFPANAAGALHVAFWLAALVGVAGALAYRALPARLTRIERDGALPEDLRGRRELLVDRLHRDASGKSDLVKRLVERVLVPYLRSVAGPLALVVSGRTLRQEQARLRARVERMLEGRGGDKLAGLDDLIQSAVELRALPARRAIGALLRSWLPLHIVAAALLLALLAVHVVAVTRLP